MATEVFLVFLRLGLSSFGGPVAHVGYFHEAFVRRRRWLREEEFAQLLAAAQMLPGPASSQLGFAIGLVRAGWRGGLAAFAGFTLPSALLMFALAAWAPGLMAQPALVHGLKLVAVVVVAHALAGMARSLAPDGRRRCIAVLALAGVLLTGGAWAQVAVIAGGAAAGWLFCRNGPAPLLASLEPRYRGGLAWPLLSLFVLGLVASQWPDAGEPSPARLAAAFYGAGSLVFGGGHVVLPLLEASVVEPGWLSQERFLAGYGAAQAVPGPMFTLSAYLGALVPTGAPAWANAGIALAAIFLPGLLLMAAVLPWWSRAGRCIGVAAAVAGINAAVVGLLAAAFVDPVLSEGVRGWSDAALVLAGLGVLQARLNPLWVVFGMLAVSAAMAAV